MLNFTKGAEYTTASWETLVAIFGTMEQANFGRVEYGVRFIPTPNVIRESEKELLGSKIISKYKFALHPSREQGGNGYFYFDTSHTIETLKEAQKKGLLVKVMFNSDMEWVNKPSHISSIGKYDREDDNYTIEFTIPKDMEIK